LGIGYLLGTPQDIPTKYPIPNIQYPERKSLTLRILLYLGKGGVGKTTIAAATALRSAELGYRTLVVSTDIAHSLADSLDRPLKGEAMEVAPNLFAQEINVLDEVREHWGKLQGYMGSMLRRQGMDKAIAEEMAIIPGMEEIVSLLNIYRAASTGDYDRVVVDAAPTGETMRLLTMPESFQWYVDRFNNWGDTAIRMTGGLLRRMMPSIDPLAGRRETAARGVEQPGNHQLPGGVEPGKNGGKGGSAGCDLSFALWLPGRRGGGQPHFARRRLRWRGQCAGGRAEQRPLSAPLAGDPSPIPGGN
jgi:hypothetical protein